MNFEFAYIYKPDLNCIIMTYIRHKFMTWIFGLMQV